MSHRHKPGAAAGSTDDQAMRDQEVLRANRELSAYFKGRRTEREARAALKIIKAFIRERERLDPGSRPPLPGAPATKRSKTLTNREAKADGGQRPGRIHSLAMHKDDEG